MAQPDTTRFPSLRVQAESWPIAGSVAISRGSKSEAVVVVATLTDGRQRGRGQCVPYGRFGETMAWVAAAIEATGEQIERGLDRAGLQSATPPGAASWRLDKPEA